MKRLLTALALVILPAEVPAQQPVAQPLTLDRLGGLFKEIGCDVAPVRNARGQHVGFAGRFQSKAHGRTFDFQALLGGDGATVWLTVALAKVEDVEGVPSEIFLRLLSANRRVAPAFFAYTDADCGLSLYLPAYGLGLTAAGLEQQLDRLAETMQTTASLWRTQDWPRKTPLADPKK